MARILVIDDDEDFRMLAKAYLCTNEHEVILARDAFEAQDLLDIARFDLVLCDVNMPRKSGFNLVTELRRGLRNKFLTIAFLTGRTDKRDIQRAIDIGADGYIVKPIEKESFLEQVEKLLLKNPGRTDLTLDIPETFDDPISKIVIEIGGHLLQISDVGVLIEAKHALREGDVVLYDSKIFSLIGVKPPVMTVNTIREILGRNAWQLTLVYRNPPFETLQKIQAWLKGQKSGIQKAI